MFFRRLSGWSPHSAGYIRDAFVEKLKAAVSKLRVGVGTDENVNIGPLINDTAATDVLTFITDAVKSGAQLVTGCRQSKLGNCFVEPTVLINTTCPLV